MASATITNSSNLVGGPKKVVGYFTADATTTSETVDLSAYGLSIDWATAWIEDDVATNPPAFVRSTSYSSTDVLTIVHTSPSTTSAVIKFEALMR
jgi:hypothetical protein